MLPFMDSGPSVPIPLSPGAPPHGATADAERIGREARLLLEEARALLDSLRDGRQVIEAKLEEQGRQDAIRLVRGSSALDEAIGRTERMLEDLRAIGQAGRGG